MRNEPTNRTIGQRAPSGYDITAGILPKKVVAVAFANRTCPEGLDGWPREGGLPASRRSEASRRLGSPRLPERVNATKAADGGLRCRTGVDRAGLSFQAGSRCCTVHTSGTLCLTPAMPSTHRLSVNLSPEEHREIAALAETSRVSKAWIGRQAVIEFLERYRDDETLQLPLDLRRASRRGNRP